MRALVVRIGRAGDLVMTTPALTAIINSYQDIQITLLTGPDGRRILKSFHPAIKEIWIWNRSGIGALFNKIKIRKKVRQAGFDMIFCFDTSERIASLFKGLDTKLYWRNTPDHLVHCSRSYLNLVEKAVGTKIKDIRPSLYLSPNAEQQVEKELKEYGISASDKVVMLHPSFSGSSHFRPKNPRSVKHRLWPARNFSELGDQLARLKLPDDTNPKVVIDLIPEEARLGEEIKKFSNGGITLLISPPNFERYKALIKRADLFVSPNTGPMHIASAMNTPIVTLFSDWDPAECGPFMQAEKFTALRAEDTPCPEQGLSAISVETVLNACKQQLLKTG